MWFPNYIETVEKELENAYFTNTIHSKVKTDDQIKEGSELFWFGWRDVSDAREQKAMLDGQSFISLTFGAQTRKAYMDLEEGWTTTPMDKYSDWYMWRKFVVSYPSKCTTCPVITAINFPKNVRANFKDSSAAMSWNFFNRTKDKNFLKYFDTIHIKRIYELQNHITLINEHMNNGRLRIDNLENENRVLKNELHERQLEIQSAQQYSSNLENALNAIKESRTFRVASFLQND